MSGKTILWRRLDQPGHDAARLWFQDPFWCLEGTALFVEGKQICRLNYQIYCDTAWNTVSGEVTGWVGEKFIAVEFSADPTRRWLLNGINCGPVEGCIDVDLNFTPATNLLPIRRLQLPIGKEAIVRSAWLRFPEFTFEVLEQVYRRVSSETYRYETLDGKFAKDLTTNDVGFVTRYTDFLVVEAENP